MTLAIESKPFELKLTEGTGSSLVLIGCSKSGKTTLMKYIYKNYFTHTIPLFFTLNAHTDIYKDFGSKIICYDDYNPNILKAAHAINSAHHNKFPFFVITDDIVGNKLKNDPQITRLMTVYRNAGMDCLLSVQDPTLLSCVGRNNANYICIFKQQTSKRWMAVVEEFLIGWFPLGTSKMEIIHYCQEVTKDHSFFMIDNINNTIALCKLTAEQANL
jgi:hypothetical protein